MSAVLALPEVKDFLQTLAKGKEKEQEQGKEHGVNAHAVTEEGEPSKKPWDEDIPELSSPSYSSPTSFSYSSDSSSSSNPGRRKVITSAEFHPVQCNTLVYSSSKGTIRLVDMRQSALCDRHTKIFEEVQAPGTSSFFTEIIASISDIKFPKGGRYILSRDYMSLKLWDMNMESTPVSTFKVHEYLRPKLCDLYENDSIFDKFDCCPSGDGLRVTTGSYSNFFRVFGVMPGSDEAATLEASKHPTKRFSQTVTKPSRSLTSFGRRGKKATESSSIDTQIGDHDFKSKLLHMAWHPQSNLIACAALNSLYMYYA
ncbi:hypothetical protein L7F22_031252 [Adiantum nelumboides]|nr:hypothetical protein [Adiantum nelumboides]